jgi:hypothetical protein
MAIPGVTPAAPKRPPLLREGSFLRRASGTIRRDESRREWIFVPSGRDVTGLEREIVLLPNDVLTETIRLIQLAPAPLTFEVSGEIFIYRSRNFVLASMALPFAAPAAASPAPAAAVPAVPSADPQPLPTDEEAIAAELERRLADRIGAVPKAPLAVPSPVPPPPADDTKSASVGARIQSRRGQLVRDAATGGWRFVFDGQRSEGGEPSMPVLPCLVLERVEQLIRENDGALPLLASGVTTTFEGRLHLLPTAFRVATGGKGINP